MNRFVAILSVLLLCATSHCANAEGIHTISPISKGLLQAKTGEERYEILLKTHQEALRNGLRVDYSKLDTIDITIPVNGQYIPLGAINDFSGVVFRVSNHSKDIFLFAYQNEVKAVSVHRSSIDKRVFDSYPELSAGTKILVVEDKNPWVKNRTGYTYGHIRKDVLLIKNGRAQNKTIMPYNNIYSSVSCKYYDTGETPYVKVSNLSLIRTSDCTSKTFLLNILGANDVMINNVSVTTPPNNLVSDLAICIYDCTNVSFENVTINGTYSRTDYSGYGISMDNVWNFKAKNLKCRANWGIFGNNNINTAKIQDSDINRFDIHCYGKDITFNNCIFRSLYNQFSSVYGKIKFNKCKFVDFTPVLFEPSYNAYVKFDLRFKDCEIYSSKTHDYLIYAVGLNGERTTERNELSQQEYPNLYVNGLKVIGDNPYYIYMFDKKVIQWPKDEVPSMKRIRKIEFIKTQNQ